MTAVLERTEPAAPPPPTRSPSRFARWWSGWRVAIRLARRDAWRGKGRASLVVLLIALPVAAVVGGLAYSTASDRINSTQAVALRSLGTVADASITPVGAPAEQSVDASVTSGGSGPRPSTSQILAALPAGSRMVDAGGSASVIAEAGPWGLRSWLQVADTSEPMNAGRWIVDEGRLPASTTEIALGVDDARRLQVKVGDTVTITATTGSERVARLTLVGLVRPYSQQTTGNDGVVLPGVVDIDPEMDGKVGIVDPSQPARDGGPTSYLVTTPTPLTWSDVRALNAIGAVVISRTVLESPPTFCPVGLIVCLDSGIPPQFADGPVYESPDQVARAARDAALVVVVLVLIVLQVALLAGPAFAVQLRRRQRELGLVGASGGTSADLRRTVLASGVVLGVAGGVLGIAFGWGAVLLLGGLLPWAPLAVNGVQVGIPPLPVYALGVALIGLIAAVVASLIPAVIAGRSDTVGSLRGRRPLPPLRGRTPVIGLLLGIAGIAVMAYGRLKVDGLVLVVGILLGELGLVLVMPWLVVQCGRLGRWLPLSSRMAVRDAGRHRLRTAAAACAIAAAACAGVAVSTWATSTSTLDQSMNVAFPPGALGIQAWEETDAAAATLTGRVERAVAAIDPGAKVTPLLGVAPTAYTDRSPSATRQGSVGCVVPASSVPELAPDAGTAASAPEGAVGPDGDLWLPCSGRSASNGSLGGEVMVLQDPAQLGLILGPTVDPAEGIAELERGGAVVLQPNALDAEGRVVLQSMMVGNDGTITDSALTRVPGLEILDGALPASVVLGPRSLPAGASIAADPHVQMLVVTPEAQDRPDRPTFADQLDLGLAKARIPGGVATSFSDPISSEAFQLIVYGVGALALALLAGLMVTALALADGRGDLSTLAAVGAEPRMRRRFSASSAGFVAALGCTTGVASGLVLAWLLNPLFNRFGSSTVVVHWWLVAFVLVGIPLVTAGAAWLTTRSRIPLTRRPD